MKRKHARDGKNLPSETPPLTSSEKQRIRREGLDKLAQDLGFKTWSRFETWALNNAQQFIYYLIKEK